MYRKLQVSYLTKLCRLLFRFLQHVTGGEKWDQKMHPTKNEPPEAKNFQDLHAGNAFSLRKSMDL